MRPEDRPQPQFPDDIKRDQTLADLDQEMQDLSIAQKYLDYYVNVGPAHLPTNICAALERHLTRKANRSAP